MTQKISKQQRMGFSRTIMGGSPSLIATRNSYWKKKTRSLLFFQILPYAILGFTAFIVVIPFFWMISTSLKTQEAFQTVPIQWIPESPTLDAYKRVFGIANVDFLKAYTNSALYTLLRMSGQVICAAMAAFVFAKIRFRGREVLFLAVLASMMVPMTAVMIPNYLILKSFRLLNTYTGLILPSLMEGLYIFILRQYMKGIDDAYLEAAAMDGASLRSIFARVVAPLCTPALFTLVLFAFMGSWNDYLWPLIVLSKKSKWTLQVALGVLNSSYNEAYDVLMAGALISIIPIVLVYLVTQRYVDKGVAVGGVKG
ncbi:MAG: carbohydrate ABC transporter permease [Spirochaetales bacterium]|nr:carbohydrate ABC transporter permease [Spirochaetales bacterium]